MRSKMILPLLALTGCAPTGDLVSPEDPDFAKGGKLQVNAESIAEDATTVTVEISWTGGTATTYDVEARGPEATETFSVATGPVTAVLDKYLFGDEDQYTSDYTGRGCVRPEGAKRFRCDDVLIPGVWPSEPPPVEDLAFARPIMDMETGSWTANDGGDLWERLDEGRPHDSDVSFIRSTGNPDTSGSWIVELGDVTDPEVSWGHWFRAYQKKDQIGGRAYDVHYELWQGLPDSGTLITEAVDWDVTNSYRLGTTEWKLCEAEADAITNYGELYVRGFAVSDGGGQRRAIEITLVELEVPSGDAEEPEIWCPPPPEL